MAVRGDCLVVIKKLSPNTTAGDIEGFFEDVGGLVQTRFGVDSITGDPTGAAYCAFETPAQATQALELDGLRLNNQVVEIGEMPKRALVMDVKREPERGGAANPQVVLQNPVRLSQFSGDPKPKGGEVSFEVWKYEVECLQRDDAYSAEALARLVRRSLRGEAGQLILHLGVEATVAQVVDKLEGFYGTVESGAVLLQQLYSTKQGADESITAYSTRLQLAIDKAEQRRGIPPQNKDETLRVIFWKGLCKESLKMAIRHKYEAVASFDELVRVARLVEQENEDFKKFHGSQGPEKFKSRVGAHVTKAEPPRADLVKELNDLKERLKEVELAGKPQPSQAPPRSRNNGRCFNCNQLGHFARNCPNFAFSPAGPTSLPVPGPPPNSPMNVPPMYSAPYVSQPHNSGPLNMLGPPPRGGR